MGQDVPIDFGSRSNPGEFGHDGGTRHINARVEDAGVEGKARLIIKAVPGLKEFATFTDGAGCRGMIPVRDKLLTVFGRQLFGVDGVGTATAIPGGVPNDSPVRFALNRQKPNPQVAMVNEGNKWIVQNNVQTPITDPDLPPPIDVTFVDGYFVYILPDGRWFISGIDLGGQISALDSADAEGAPDGLVGAGARARELFLVGEESTEVWTNTGADAFPFQRLPGVFIETGCIARNTITNFAGTLAWVTNRTKQEPYRVIMMDGYTPIRISNHAIERAIEDLDDPSELKAFSYAENGHATYVLSSSKWTWAFDHVPRGLSGWYERESVGRTGWRGLWAAPFAGKVIIGDSTINKLYELNRTHHDEDGSDLIMKLRSPIQHAFPRSLSFNYFTADMLRGEGLESGSEEDTNPVVMLRWSQDGGFNWSAPRQMAAGKLGERMTRMSSRKLGQSRGQGRMWELSMAAAVSRAFLQASVNVTGLTGK